MEKNLGPQPKTCSRVPMDETELSEVLNDYKHYKMLNPKSLSLFTCTALCVCVRELFHFYTYVERTKAEPDFIKLFSAGELYPRLVRKDIRGKERIVVPEGKS